MHNPKEWKDNQYIDIVPEKIKLERVHGLDKSIKHEHLGPKGGGRFWALKDLNDLPLYHPTSTIYLQKLFDAGAEVYMQDAEQPGTWSQITSVYDVPEVEVTIFPETYDKQGTDIYYSPMLEFYVVGHGGDLRLPPRQTTNPIRDNILLGIIPSVILLAILKLLQR